MKDRKLFSMKDGFLIALLLLLGGVWLVFSRGSMGAARVVAERNGEVVFSQELSQVSEPKEISLSGENGLTLVLTLYPDGVQVTKADCPDRLCVGAGKLKRAGETAVCLPARLSVRLEGEKGPDAFSY